MFCGLAVVETTTTSAVSLVVPPAIRVPRPPEPLSSYNAKSLIVPLAVPAPVKPDTLMATVVEPNLKSRVPELVRVNLNIFCVACQIQGGSH